jgi:hypothetical protein
MSQLGQIDLPHGAWINLNTNRIHLNFGQVTLNWTLEEFELWLNQIEDIVMVYQSLTMKSSVVCDTCGTLNEIVDVVTDEKDYN